MLFLKVKNKIQLQEKDKYYNKLDKEARGRFEDQKYFLEHEQLLKNKTSEVDEIRKYKDVIEKEFERKQKLNLFMCVIYRDRSSGVMKLTT